MEDVSGRVLVHNVLVSVVIISDVDVELKPSELVSFSTVELVAVLSAAVSKFNA